MKNKRALKDMNIEEVSIVDKGANRKKWFLIKREDGQITELTIKTDGTANGTGLTVNGEEVDDLKSFWFMLWPSDDFDDGMMSGSFTVNETDGAEFDRETTFNLKKGMNTMELKDVLKKLNVDPASLSEELTKDLENLIQFVDMMPPENGASALNIIKSSLVKEESSAEGDTPGETTTEGGTPAEETLSPEDMAEIRSAMSRLNNMLPESERVVMKVEEPSDLQLILAALEKRGKPEDSGDDAPQTVAEMFQAIVKRVEKVEKTTGVSEDEGEDAGEDLSADGELTKEERLKKYGTLYPKAQSNWGMQLLQHS